MADWCNWLDGGPLGGTRSKSQTLWDETPSGYSPSSDLDQHENRFQSDENQGDPELRHGNYLAPTYGKVPQRLGASELDPHL